MDGQGERDGGENPVREALEACDGFAARLYELALNQAKARAGMELQWLKDARQFYGIYEPHLLADLSKTKGSKLYANQTRPKCITLMARFIDMMFPTDDENWDLKPTPVPSGPDLRPEAVDPDTPLGQAAAAEGAEAARGVRELADERCENMKRLIRDQLAESRYPQACEKAISQLVRYGTCVLKGPFADWRPREQWKRVLADGGGWTFGLGSEARPAFEWVNVWDFYPDMEAQSMEDCEFVFQLRRMSGRQLRALAKRSDFRRDAIRDLLARGPNGYEGQFENFTRYVRTLRGEALEQNTSRFEVFEYHGSVPRKTFKALCTAFEMHHAYDAMVDARRPLESYDACIWFCQDRVLKFALNPLESEELPYSTVSLDEGDTGFFGHSLPTKQRDSQRSINSIWRLLHDNAGLSGVPMFVVRKGVVDPVDGQFEIKAGKIWLQRSDTEQDPLRALQIDGNTQGLLELLRTSLQFMDDETNLPLAAQGAEGVSARQTAHGMSLLVAAVNIVFRFMARNWDTNMTLPNLRRLYQWNMQMQDDESVKGDMQVSPRGSTHLLVKEVVAQNLTQLLNIAATNPILAQTLDIGKISRKLVAAYQLSSDDIVRTDEQVAELQAEEAENAPPSPEAIKLQTAQLQSETALEIAKINYDGQLVQAAGRELAAREKLEADIERQRMADDSRERMLAAEIGAEQPDPRV